MKKFFLMSKILILSLGMLLLGSCKPPKLEKVFARLQDNYVVYVNEPFDNGKVEVTTRYTNGMMGNVLNNFDVTFSEVNTAKPGMQELNINYQGFDTTLNIEVVDIKDIKVAVNSGEKITTDDTDSEIKQKITVTATYMDQKDMLLDKTKYQVAKSEDSFKVTYLNKEKELPLINTKQEKITAVKVTCKTGITVFASDSDEVIKSKIIVNALKNNGEGEMIDVGSVTVNRNPEKTKFWVSYSDLASNELDLTPVMLAVINVEIKPNEKIYAGDTEDIIKEKIVVTGICNDANFASIDMNEVSITPAIAQEGNNKIFTVTYQEKTATLTADVISVTSTAVRIITPPLAKPNLIYNGSAQELIIKGEAEGGIIKYSFDKIDYQEESPTAVGAGEYIVYYKAFADDMHQDTLPKAIHCFIGKKVYQMPEIVFNNQEFVYDGTEKELKITGDLPTGVIVRYENNKLTDVGVTTAKAILSYSDTINYEPITITKEAVLTIKKQTYELPAGVSFNDQSYRYDGTEKELKITGTLPEGFNVTYANNKLKDVGSKIAVATFTFPDNTTITKDALLAILPKEVTLEWNNLRFDYDGTEQFPDFNLTGIIPGDSCNPVKSGAETDAGSYIAKIESLNNPNYELPQNNEQKYEINKTDAAIINLPSSLPLEYNGCAQPLLKEGTGEGGYFRYRLNNGGYRDSVPMATDAGEYKVIYEFIGDKNHNSLPAKEITVTIAKADSKYNTEPSAVNDLIFDEGLKELLTTGDAEGGKILYGVGPVQPNELSESLPQGKDAGKYTVYYMLKGDKNHNDIALRSLEVTIGEQIYTSGLIYNLENNGEYTVTGISEDVNVTELIIPKQYMGHSVTKISPDAFKNLIELTSVTIYDNIKEVGKDAFLGCTNIETANVPLCAIPAIPRDKLIEATITGKGDIGRSRDFTNNKTIKKVTLGEGITGIMPAGDWGCFEGCLLEEINIYNKNIRIGSYAFNNANNIKVARGPFVALSPISKTNLEKVTITSGEITDNAFKGCKFLKEVIFEEDVTSIGKDAFMGCTSLEKIIFKPESKLEKIGNNAFKNCGMLDEIMLPAGILSIGKDAFDGTLWYQNMPDGLVYLDNVLYKYKGEISENIALKDDLKVIADYAFGNQPNLTEIVIPKYVKNIGFDCFRDCPNLIKINVDSDNDRYQNDETCHLLLDKKDHTLIYACNTTSITIPLDTKKIEVNAFADCTQLTSIEIPAATTKIEKTAFKGCINLATIVVKNKDIDIAADAFSGIFSIEKAEIPAKAITPLRSAMKNALKEITIKDGIIPESAFYDFKCLEKVILSDTITQIKASAFTGCSALKEITLPSSITSLYDYTFKSCTSLTKVLFMPESKLTSIGYEAFSGCSKLASIALPDMVTTIKGSSFKGCMSLASVTLNDKLTNIDANAFEGCSSLTSIAIPDKVTTINRYAFKNCSSLIDITIGRGLTQSMQFAFEGCTNIKNVNIYALDKWCQIAFENNLANPLEYGELSLSDSESFVKIKDLVLPGTITEIKPYAFINLNITSLSLPESLTKIGASAFAGCKNLTSVNIPVNVKEIGLNAFTGCDLLEELKADPENNIYYSEGNCILTDKGQKTLVIGCNKSTIPGDIKVIGENAFYKCNIMDEIEIPESVVRIEKGAFKECDNLKKVIIHDAIKYCGIQFMDIDSNPLTIAHDLYYGTDKVEEINVTDDAQEIRDFAFYNCNSLKKVIISESIPVGNNSFAGCIGIEEARIPIDAISKIPKDNLRIAEIIGTGEIYSEAFNNCQKLEKITINTGITSLAGWFSYNYYRAHGAIHNCDNLKEIIIKNNDIEINIYAFAESDNITDVTAPGCILNTQICKNKIQKINITGGIIPNNAFNISPTDLTEVTIGPDVKSIGKDAFKGTPWLDNLTASSADGNIIYICDNSIALAVKGTLTGDVKLDPKTRLVAGGAFANQTQMTSIEIPSTVENIGEDAFIGCTALTSVKTPDLASWMKIKFMNLNANPLTLAHKLQVGSSSSSPSELDIPGDVIDVNNFAGMKDLTKVVIPENITGIGKDAFNGCVDLKELNLPRSLNKISEQALQDCTHLAVIKYSGSMAEWKQINKGPNWSKFVPAKYVSANDGYITLDGATLKAYTPGLTYDAGTVTGNNAVNTDPDLTIKEMHDANLVTIIKDNAFKDNLAIKSVIIPYTIQKIGSGAFSSCNNLTKIIYLGTEAEWTSLLLNSPDWQEGLSTVKTVNCIDKDWQMPA